MFPGVDAECNPSMILRNLSTWDVNFSEITFLVVYIFCKEKMTRSKGCKICEECGTKYIILIFNLSKS